MFELLGGALSSILGGGVTGLFGIITQRFFDLRNKKLDIEASREKFAHELELRKVDAAIMSAEWHARTQVAEIEGAARVEVADSQAFAASFNEPQRYAETVKPSRGQGWMLILLDFIRGVVRPGLTIYLCILTTLVYLNAQRVAEAIPLKPEDAVEIIKRIVETILYLTSTCLLWWFGSRNRVSAVKAGR